MYLFTSMHTLCSWEDMCVQYSFGTTCIRVGTACTKYVQPIWSLMQYVRGVDIIMVNTDFMCLTKIVLCMNTEIKWVKT